MRIVNKAIEMSGIMGSAASFRVINLAISRIYLIL